MSRAARIKEPEAIYHVMSRSITEFDLFPDNSDREYFLDIYAIICTIYQQQVVHCLATKDMKYLKKMRTSNS